MNSKIINIVTDDVCRLTGLSREEHFMLQVDCGLEYLDIRYRCNIDIRDSLSQGKDFWIWWRELWAKRDKELMVKVEPKAWGHDCHIDGVKVRMFCEIQVQRFYRHWHNPNTIVIYPNWQIIKNSISNLNNVHI